MGLTLKKRNRGVTLVEVMIAAIAVLAILIGVMSYQYCCALDVRKADVRATAGRLGLLLLDAWKAREGDVLTYDPELDLSLFLPDGNQFLLIDPPPQDPPGLTNPFRYYSIEVNGAKYFVKLSYADNRPEPPIGRMLNASVAWSRNFGSDTLAFDAQRLIKLTNYASYSLP